jgi:DNA/RNA-binding domain of Phe-tRNA-synthetase-like protein
MESAAGWPEVGWAIEHPDLIVGWVFADGLDVGPSQGELRAWFEAKVRQVADPPEATRQAIRQLLKRGGFKATGRNKPASEYLAEARRAGTLPAIYDVVDVNNALSLETGWPMSVLDLDRALACSPSGGLEIRFGRAGESFVFNGAGQVIEVSGLLGVAAAGGPMLGNPVKDAMNAKVVPHTRRIVAVIYTSRLVATPDRVLAVARELAERLGVRPPHLRLGIGLHQA